MMNRRPALSSVTALLIVAALALAAFAGYEALTPPVISTTTVTNTSTSVLTTTTSFALSPLISYSADAYSAETQVLLTAFSTSTGIPVAPVKSGGSFADANQIAAGAPDDVFVSVSLSATGPAYLKNLSSNWAIGFASDQMVLAYANATQSNGAVANTVSLGQRALSSNATVDWNSFFVTLTSGSVKLGISNPVTDPAGLRGWLVLEAASHLYAGGDQQAYVSSTLKARANVTGSNAAALVASLQSGQIQFLFIYKSAAIADHIAYLTLDRHVNLSDPSLANYYSQFSYTDSAGTNAGAPIILVITVPLDSLNQIEALEFVQYVIKNAGSLAPYGLVIFPQPRLYHNVAPPQAIQLLLTQGVLLEAGTYH
jgi:molybdate/tungstate transport system substrate-binding protein